MQLKRFIFALTAMLAMLVGLQQPLSAAIRAEKNSRQEKYHKHSSSSSQYAHKNPPLPGTWAVVPNGNFGVGTQFPGFDIALLLTDGSIMVVNNNCCPYVGEVWKLTPDAFGSYENGTWSQLASLPADYLPAQAQAEAVLADGRVIFAGAERTGPLQNFDLSNKCAIYDPVTDTWTRFAGPDFFINLELSAAEFPNPIGEAACVILEDGTFMIADKASTQAALLDLKTLKWTETGTASKAPHLNNEEGWTLLPNGKVLTVNCYVECDPLAVPNPLPYPANPTGSQIYNPKTGKWKSAGSTINTLTDPITFEMGPAVLRPDGTVFCVGSQGFTSIYDSCNGKWRVGPTLPIAPSPIAEVTINPPNGAAGTYVGRKALRPISDTFRVPAVGSAPIEPTIPFNADTPVTNDLTGKIALIATDGFATGSLNKGNNAAAAGAIGCIFYDSTGSNFTNIGGSSLVPSMIVDFATGQILTDPTNLPGLSGTITSEPRPLGNQDGPAALLPNGNVLFVASPFNIPFGSGPTSFFEFDGSQLIEQPAPLQDIAENPEGTSLFHLLPLPTGQVLMTNPTSIDAQTPYSAQIYTPGDRSYNPDWAPRICDAPEKVRPGKTYKIKGIKFNGMSQAQGYGDENMAATNYPLVRITNNATGHVFYCRTHDHSYMGVASCKKVHTYFDVPDNIEHGKSTLEVVANGIPSEPKHIYVK